MDFDFIIQIESNFGLKILRSIKIERGSADVYLIYTNNGKYVVKHFLKKHTYDRVYKELIICDYLRERGICIPSYIQSSNNKRLDTYDNRIYTISTYIEGLRVDANQFDVTQLEESIQLYFQIVRLLNKYPYKLRAFDKSKYSLKAINNTIEYLKTSIKNNEKSLLEIRDKKISLLEHLKKCDIASLSQMTHLYSHGDYTHFQFIYDNNYHIKAITDWSSVKELPISYELFRSFIYQIKSYNKNNGGFNLLDLHSYIEKIKKYYNLSKIDILYISFISFCRRAMSSSAFSLLKRSMRAIFISIRRNRSSRVISRMKLSL